MAQLFEWFQKKKKLLIFGGTCLILLLLQIIIFAKSSFPLTGDDNIVHYTYISEIIESKSINMQRFYPFGIHVIVAVLYFLTGFSITKVLITLTFIIVSIAPLGFYYLTKILTEKEETALYVTLVTPLVYIIPLRIYSWGGYPFLWGLTLLWFYAGFTIDAFKKQSASRTLIALALGCLLFLIHSPEFVTANIFILCYALIYYRKLFRQIPVYLYGIGNGLIFLFLYYFLKTRTSYDVGVWHLSFDTHPFLEGIAYLWKYEFGYYIFLGWVFVILFFWGFAKLLKKMKFPSGEVVVIVNFVILTLIFIDIVFLQNVSFLYKLFFPWGEKSRFFEFFIFPLAFIIGFGLKAFIPWWKSLENLVLKNAILYVVLVFTLSPLLINSFYFQPIVAKMSPPEEFIVATQYISQNLDPSKIILNDLKWGYLAGEKVYRSADFASWINALTNSKVAFPYDHQPAKESFEKRYYVLENIHNLGKDDQLKQYIEDESIHYVFWEAKTWWQREHYYLQIEDLQQNTYLDLIYTSEPSCREDYTGPDCIFIFQIQNL